MSDIFNILKPFFEDCSQQYGVREYAKLQKVSPPTASTILKGLTDKGLLKSMSSRQQLLFWANRENPFFVALARIYWHQKLQSFIDYCAQSLVNPTLILFGSLAKGENTAHSDVDIALLSVRKELAVEKFEKRLQRKIHLFHFHSLQEIRDKELRNNILNGYVISGILRL